MSAEQTELRYSNNNSNDGKRRRSVHFDSAPKTVVIPGESEEAEWRGKGTGHFSDHEKELIEKELSSGGISPAITDETAEQLRFRQEKSRRKSEPHSSIYYPSTVLENECEGRFETQNAKTKQNYRILKNAFRFNKPGIKYQFLNKYYGNKTLLIQ